MNTAAYPKYSGDLLSRFVNFHKKGGVLAQPGRNDRALNTAFGGEAKSTPLDVYYSQAQVDPCNPSVQTRNSFSAFGSSRNNR
jgi:hypothetical protein